MTEDTKPADQFQALFDALDGEHTALPWIGAGPSFGAPLPVKLDSIIGAEDEDGFAETVCRDTSDEDNALIAAAVNAAPALLAEVERLQRSLANVQSDFTALQRALVGNTGASAITVAKTLRADAERYRWLREQLDSRTHDGFPAQGSGNG